MEYASLKTAVFSHFFIAIILLYALNTIAVYRSIKAIG